MKIIRLLDCKNSVIKYDFIQTPFGEAIVAATETGVCYMGLDSNVSELDRRFAGALFVQEHITPDFETLHLKGTDFQLSVWSELLNIPSGKTFTYSQLAEVLGSPKAQRAVGSAVGSNPVSLVIPCHRVVAANGGLGGYYWGVELKKRILAAEQE